MTEEILNQMSRLVESFEGEALDRDDTNPVLVLWVRYLEQYSKEKA